MNIEKIAARLCLGAEWLIPITRLLSEWREMCRSGDHWEMLEGLCLFLSSLEKELSFSKEEGGLKIFIPTDGITSISVGCQFVKGGLSVNSWPIYHKADGTLSHELREWGRPWKTAMSWKMEMARAMGFEDVAIRCQERVLKCEVELVPVVRQLWGRVEQAISEVAGSQGDGLFDVALADWNIPDGKIGSYKHMGELPWGLLTISPKVFQKPGKIYYVVAHELIHAGLGQDEASHGDMFQEISNNLGIPEKYQD